MDDQLWHCSDCGGEREFVQPTCVDGHTEDGELCPEWACAECGAAVVADVPLPVGELARAGIAA